MAMAWETTFVLKNEFEVSSLAVWGQKVCLRLKMPSCKKYVDPYNECLHPSLSIITSFKRKLPYCSVFLGSINWWWNIDTKLLVIHLSWQLKKSLFQQVSIQLSKMAMIPSKHDPLLLMSSGSFVPAGPLQSDSYDQQQHFCKFSLHKFTMGCHSQLLNVHVASWLIFETISSA